MLKSIMSRSWKYQIHTTELFEVAQSLKLLCVNNVPTLRNIKFKDVITIFGQVQYIHGWGRSTS